MLMGRSAQKPQVFSIAAALAAEEQVQAQTESPGQWKRLVQQIGLKARHLLAGGQERAEAPLNCCPKTRHNLGVRLSSEEKPDPVLRLRPHGPAG